jgi:hypothetical protein
MNRIITYAFGAITLLGGMSWLGMEWVSPGFQEGLLSDHGSDVNSEEKVALGDTSPKLLGDNLPLQRLEKRLSQLQQQLQDQQQMLRQQQNEIAQLTRALAMGKPSDTEDTENTDLPVQSQEEWEQMRLAQLDEEFSQEKTDVEWSQEAAGQIVKVADKVLNAHGPGGGASLVDANCRATLCRIELMGESIEAINHFAQMFPLELGWQGSMHQTVVHEPDGSVRTIMYVSKDGHELPAEEEG